VIFYAVVNDEIERVIEFFHSQGEVELMLARVLRDEPASPDTLYVEPIELESGRRTRQAAPVA
jgi:hypothetical protein